LVILALSAITAQAASVTIAAGAPGGAAQVVLKSSGSEAVSALSCTIGYDPAIGAAPSVVIGPAAKAADKKIMAVKSGKGVTGFSIVGMNNTRIGDGVVATIEFPNGDSGVKLISVQGSTPDGKAVTLTK